MAELTETGAYIRSLGGLTFTVVISEAEKATAKLTDYPVEDGVSYSDHVILAPREVTVQVGQGVDESETDPRDKLDKLRELMEAREPIELYTGKSYYKSMIITSISQTTDAKTETVLIASVTLREVRSARPQEAAVPIIKKDKQKQPKKTVASTKRGTQQVQEAAKQPQPKQPEDRSALKAAEDAGVLPPNPFR